MEISDQLRCLFSGTVEERNGSYVVEIPNEEIELGETSPGETYRIALLPPISKTEGTTEREPERGDTPPDPPVAEGEYREVEIEDIGDQGDGIARVERGFVVIVPGTELRERVTVEITSVRQNVAFADVVDRENYYD